MVNSFFEVLFFFYFKFIKTRAEKFRTKEFSDINQTLISMFLPSNILAAFEVLDIYGKQGNWIIELREKEEKIPK